ncbi:hypothetical protein BJF78_05270 [Pseudonocardia sp. CNS-139]|nr:hypothetical protein BJF78_05270 [Pseudonocardia sp. CNS-139]
MEIITLPADAVTRFGSTGVEIGPLAVFAAASGRTSVHVARLAPGGGIGRHPATGWQTFAVVAGAGWAAGGDGVRHPVAPGVAALWAPGEAHESGTDTGMVAVLVESSVRPVDL